MVDKSNSNSFIASTYMKDFLLLPFFYKPESKELADSTSNSIKLLLYSMSFQVIKKVEFNHIKNTKDAFSVKKIDSKNEEHNIITKLRNFRFYVLKKDIEVVDIQKWEIKRYKLESIRDKYNKSKQNISNRDDSSSDTDIKSSSGSNNESLTKYKVIVYHDKLLENFYSRVIPINSYYDRAYAFYLYYIRKSD